MSNAVKINIGAYGFALCVNLENFNSALGVGIINRYLTVKSAGSEQSRVEDVGAVGCGDNDNAFIRSEAVHFNKQLIQRLLSFIVTAAHACASVSADCVDFIDEYN